MTEEVECGPHVWAVEAASSACPVCETEKIPLGCDASSHCNSGSLPQHDYRHIRYRRANR